MLKIASFLLRPSSSFPPVADRPAAVMRLPLEVLQTIFTFYLTDAVYNSHRVYFYGDGVPPGRVLSLQSMVFETEDIRGVCRSWANAMRSLVFEGKGSRNGIILRIPQLLSKRNMRTFPLLRDCLVELCHPCIIDELRALQRDIAQLTRPLDYVCAVHWREDDTLEAMHGNTSHMGYGPLSHEFKDHFLAECAAADLWIMKFDVSSDDKKKFSDDAKQAIINFYFKETLALWYFNAHLVRQILSAFPCLQYLTLPSFLHVPLLANRKHFIFEHGDEPLLGPVSLAPPCLAHKLSITESDKGGRSYADIMAPVERLKIVTGHFHPVSSLFSGRLYKLIEIEHIFTPTNWHSGFFENQDIQKGISDRLKDRLYKALDDIPTDASPPLFNAQKLRRAMNFQNTY